MADAPLRLNGAKFKADKTGLISIVEPWEVATLAECYTFAPEERPFGLPIVDRSAEEFVVGTWTLYLTYEGQSDDNDVSFDDDTRLEVELDPSMSQDPIQSHPNFEQIKVQYGWSTAKEQFAETLPYTGAEAGALAGAKKSRRNPLHGTDSFLSVGAIFRVTFSARNAPRNLLDGIGTVVETPEAGTISASPPRRAGTGLNSRRSYRSAETPSA